MESLWIRTGGTGLRPNGRPRSKCDGGPRKPREQQAQPALSSSTEPVTPNRNNAHGTTTTIAETSDAAQSKAKPSGSQSGPPTQRRRDRHNTKQQTRHVCLAGCVWGGVVCGLRPLGPCSRRTSEARRCLRQQAALPPKNEGGACGCLCCRSVDGKG